MLFRDAAAIENLRKVDTLIVDKTGTLTEGRPAFNSAVPAPGGDADEVLRLAASLDQGSEHPLAQAMVSAARERGLTLEKPEAFESGSGIGVRGQIGVQPLALGNTTLMQQVRRRVGTLGSQGRSLARRGCQRDVPGERRQLLGLLAVSDPDQDEHPEALAALQKRVCASSWQRAMA